MAKGEYTIEHFAQRLSQNPYPGGMTGLSADRKRLGDRPGRRLQPQEAGTRGEICPVIPYRMASGIDSPLGEDPHGPAKRVDQRQPRKAMLDQLVCDLDRPPAGS